MAFLDLSAPVAALAEATALVMRLLTARSPQPVHAAARLQADADGLLITATDGTLTARLRVPATVHEEGEVTVPRRGLAQTLGALDAAETRLVGEGRRLAIRVPGARFALPTVADPGPQLTDLPPLAGEVDGAALRGVAAAVAGAASREHALPVFTGVRLRGHGPHPGPQGSSPTAPLATHPIDVDQEDHLSLLATDRYRLAAATVPWSPAETSTGLQALVPASLLAKVSGALGRADRVGLHADEDLFGLSWPGGSVVSATLGTAYPDAQFDRLLDVDPECVVELEADVLAQAVERATAYAGAHGRVELQVTDGAVLVRASDPLSGESEETVKAAVLRGQAIRSYQARLLTEALRCFPHESVRIRIQPALRATELTTPSAGLRYLIVPMRPADRS